MYNVPTQYQVKNSGNTKTLIEDTKESKARQKTVGRPIIAFLGMFIGAKLLIVVSLHSTINI